MYELIIKSKVPPPSLKGKEITPIERLRWLILADDSLYRTTLLIYAALRVVIAAGCVLIVWTVSKSPLTLNIVLPLAAIHIASEGFIYFEKTLSFKRVVKLIEEDADAEAKAPNSD